jgi:hypothetical protein
MSYLNVPSQPSGRAHLTGTTNTRLSGRWLILARVVWIALVVCILAYFIAGLPAIFVTLHQPCVGVWCTNAVGRLTASQMHALVKAGISLDTNAWFFLLFTGITSLVWFVVAGILFWRRSDDWMVLLVAFMLIAQGADNLTNTLLYSTSIWRLPENSMYLLSGMSMLYVFALFPNGRPVPRWTFWVPLAYLINIVCYLLFVRPLRIPGWTLYNYPLNAITWFGSFTVLIVSQAYRYFRVSTLVERQQTKWVALGFFLVLIGGLLSVGLQDNTKNNVVLYLLVGFATTLILSFLPLSIGFAMLRSRLWDIDIIINKALVYGLLTALLAAVYVVLIVSLQFLLSGIIKQNNDVVIVISTLAIAALFQPLRHRIQRIIDRRFYRRKYDAAKIVEAFSTTLRNEVDLNHLREHLLGVVQETMQPAHMSLWLRSSQPTTKPQGIHTSTPLEQ